MGPHQDPLRLFSTPLVAHLRKKNCFYFFSFFPFLPFGHRLPKGLMSYKILMRESVLFIHPSVRPFPPPPLMLPYRFPQEDFIGHRSHWKPMLNPRDPGHQGTNDHYCFLQSVLFPGALWLWTPLGAHLGRSRAPLGPGPRQMLD